jgi:AmmeMemoRadiSam system protein B
LDEAMLEQIAAFSPEGVYNTEATGKGYACGIGAVAAVLWAARALGADRVQVLHHATSGAVTGDFTSVVGYGAAAILKPV